MKIRVPIFMLKLKKMTGYNIPASPRYFVKQLCIVFLLMTPSFVYSNELCCVRGVVHDAHEIPLIGATVMIIGTSLGTMTDTTGHYFIKDIPVGSIELRARMVGMGEQNIFETGLSGDTLEVNFALGPRYMPDITWKYNGETYCDTISITVSTSMDLDEAYPQIWVGDNLMPCWRESHMSFGTTVSSREDSLQFSLFPYAPTSVELVDSKDVYYIQYPAETQLNTKNQYTNIADSHNLIDLAEWGNPVLENWGFLGSKIFYKDGAMKLLLVFCEQAVLVSEIGSVEVIDYPFSTFHFRTDPELKYLLIWDICGKEAIGGDAALICLENTICSVFDPSPEKESPDIAIPRISIGTVLGSNWIMGHEKYHVTSNGNVIRLDHTDLRIYNRSGELLNVRGLEDLGLANMHYAAQFLSDDQDAISVIHTCDSLHYRLTVDLYGNILYHSSFPYPEERPVLRIRYLYDTENSVLWFSSYNNSSFGIARVNCMNDDCLQFQGFTRHFCTSENRKYLGISCYYPDTNQFSHEIRDWNSGEILSTLWTENSAQNHSRFIGISDTGLCLLAKPSSTSNSGREYVLADSTGDIIQVFPVQLLTQLEHTRPYLSPDGAFLMIPWGRYLDVIRLSR